MKKQKRLTCKMKLTIRSAFFLFTVFTLASCEKPVSTVEGPKAEPKLAIACFISPHDSFIVLHLSKSVPVFGVKQNQPQPDITDATVIISEGATSAQLAYHSFDMYYISTSTFPVVTGKTYKLKVTTPDGLEATAECTVPGTGNNSLSFTVDSGWIDNFGDSVRQYKVDVQWTDVAGQKNYYRVYSEAVLYSTDPFGSTDTIYNHIYMGSENELVNDDSQDGQVLKLKGNYHNFHPPGVPQIPVEKIQVIRIQVEHRRQSFCGACSGIHQCKGRTGRICCF
jgi:hypothetical protein